MMACHKGASAGSTFATTAVINGQLDADGNHGDTGAGAGVFDTTSVNAPVDDSDTAALLARARAGNRDAWVALTRRFAPRLAAYLGARLHRPAVVERLVGDTIVSGWGRLNEIEDAAQFPAWFRRLGASFAIQWKTEHPQERIKEPFPESRCGDTEQLLRMRHLQEGLQRLSEQERMALEQRFRGGLTGEALAEVLHCDVATAEELVERALIALGRSLDA
jgi:RNA polymerase sigma-70 factor (ECF subfamily)